MEEIKEIACATCGFTTALPAEFIVHMMESGHGLDAEVRTELMDGGDPTELARALALIQQDPEGRDLPEGMSIGPVDLDDPDVPDEVREALRAVEAKHRRGRG